MAYLSLSLLGPFQAWTADGVSQSFRTLKERALLSYLAVEHSQPHSREMLANLFWPDRSEGIARNNLRQALYGIRQVIGEPGFSSVFNLTVDEVQFNLSDNVWLDAAAFDVHIRASRAHNHLETEQCSYCLQQLRDTVEVYRGNFLEDVDLDKNQEFQDWLIFRREQYFRMQSQSLETLIRSYESTGEYVQATMYAQRQVSMDDINENLYRRLTILLARTGQFSAAMEQFEICQRKLWEVLGKQMDPEFYRLAEQIRSGKFDSVVQINRSPVHNLPVQVTPFIGREMELSQISRYLATPACRLLTLAGPGGVGKTRLAIEAGLLHLQSFPGGTFFVPLDQVQSADRLVETIGAAIGLTTGGSQDFKVTLLDFLRSRHVLLILDNFEHLMDGKGLLLEILQAAPFVRIIVTSRENLNYQVEFTLEVQGLPFPERMDTGRLAPLDAPMGIEGYEYAAVRLFLERASRVRGDFIQPDSPLNGFKSLDRRELKEVIRICRLVDGLPLALELAASWAKGFSFKQIADEIERSLDFLQTTFQDVPERHRNLRASFENSWDLLSESEREVFCKLSVFPGAFSIAAAEAISNAALPWLLRLENKSLIRRVAPGRYGLHPLLRQFASQKLRQYARKIEDQTKQQHAEFFSGFLRDHEAGLKGQRQAAALSEINEEIENVRAAWDWTIEHRAWHLFDQSAASLMLFFETLSRWNEGEDYFGRALQSLQPLPVEPPRDRIVAFLMACKGWFCCRLTRFQEAESLILQSLKILEHSEPGYARVFSHFALGFLYVWINRYRESWATLSASQALAAQVGDDWMRAWSLQAMTEIAFESGQSGFQVKPFLETLALFERLGELRGSSRALNYLGNITLAQERYEEAGAYFQKMYAYSDMIGDLWGAASGCSKLGQLALARGDYEQAWNLYQRSLSMLQKTGDQRRSAYVQGELGESASALRRFKEAEQHFCDAFEIARLTHNDLLAQDITARVASALLHVGQTRRAVLLLRLALSVPSGDPLTIRRAGRLQEIAQARLAGENHPEPEQEPWTGIWEAVELMLKVGIHLDPQGEQPDQSSGK